MTDDDLFLVPSEARESLSRAEARDRKASAGRMRVQVGEAWYPIAALDDAGFEVALDVAPKLRGLVEIHEGPRLLRSALIVAMGPIGDVMRYAFKRTTAPRMTAPLDYERTDALPSGYLAAT